MTGILKEQIGDNPVLVTLLLLLLFAYFVYKEWPDFKKRISGQAVAKKDVESRLDSIEHKLDELNTKVSRDYIRLNAVEVAISAHDKELEASLEERRLLMTGMLAALKGLKEQGCNGPVTEAISDFEGYMIRESHERR